MIRASVLAFVLLALAACAGPQAEGGNPGLFEPRMFNDLPYNVSFVGAAPVEDPALLAQGFVTSRDIEVFRMAGAPFEMSDATEAEAVARDFCAGAGMELVATAQNITLDRGGFVFAQSCLVREA